jgi:hypothetical protein
LNKTDLTFKLIKMKARRTLTALTICIALSFTATSCLVLVPVDKGGRKGWNKNSNNPHHPKTTNPGHNKGKSRN